MNFTHFFQTVYFCHEDVLKIPHMQISKFFYQIKLANEIFYQHFAVTSYNIFKCLIFKISYFHCSLAIATYQDNWIRISHLLYFIISAICSPSSNGMILIKYKSDFTSLKTPKVSPEHWDSIQNTPPRSLLGLLWPSWLLGPMPHFNALFHPSSPYDTLPCVTIQFSPQSGGSELLHFLLLTAFFL